MQSMKASSFLFRKIPITVASLSLAMQAFAAPTLTSQTLSVDENTANGTLLGQVTASGGTASTTLQLDVGTLNISNWSTRSEDYESVDFNTTFSSTPIVLTQIQSDGDYTIIYTVDQYNYSGSTTTKGYETIMLSRQKNTSTTGFEAILESELWTGGSSVVTSIDYVDEPETVGWLAISEATQGIWSGLPFESLLSSENVTDSTTSLSFSGPFDSTPNVMTSIATGNEDNRTNVGITGLSQSQIKVFMDELNDGSHASEAVSVLALQGDGSLQDVNGNIIGETGIVSFNDSTRNNASTVSLLNTYSDPVVFVQPVETSEDIEDAAFRFTDIASNSFSGFLLDEDEVNASGRWGTFDLHYFVFEKGTWEIGIETYAYSITAGNDSGAFAIDADTGEITVADSSQLDYESGVTQYTLTVQVTDGVADTGTTTVTIDINNVSDSLNSDAQTIQGLAANNWTGWQTAAAGDVNGDGFDDIVVGAPKDDTNGDNAGAAYVLFGNSSGTLSSLSDVVAGTGGFVMYGAAADEQAGQAVGGGADINGDGLDDVVIGSPYSDTNGTESGKAYVVFGKNDTTAVQLADIALDSNDGGFVMNGASSYDWAGGSFVMGDVNGDGLADIAVGEPLKKDNGTGISLSITTTRNNLYWAYVVFGKTEGTAIELADIADDSNEQGFVMSSSNRSMFDGWEWGSFVMSAGDFNTDGLADFALNTGLYSARDNYLMFGKVGGTAISMGDSITGNGEGFVITSEGSEYGFSFGNNTYLNSLPSFLTSAIGDVNADGIDDLALLATDIDCCSDWTEPRAYVIFGTTAANDIDLADIASGNGGFVIYNDASSLSFGSGDLIYGSISGAGDINGDGYDDR